MNLTLYPQVKRFVTDSFTIVGKTSQLIHFERAVHWIKELKNDADVALLIAAVSHDIERAFRKEDMTQKRKIYGYTGKGFIRPHEERGAEIIGTFLQKEGADSSLVNRVKMLVSRHEEGGNDDQNLLKDADSISFFENSIPIFLAQHVNESGKDLVKKKFSWMYDRISSEKAKQIVRGWYENAIIRLGK